LTTKHVGGTVVAVVVGAGRAIALKATDASVDDTGDGIFDVGVLAVLVLVVLLVVEERRQRGLDWRLTTKNVSCTDVGVGGCAIALEATDASVDGTMDEIFGVLGDTFAVLVNRLEERVARVIVVFREWRSTTKHGVVVVVA